MSYSSDVPSDHSSDDIIESKIDWLSRADAYLEYMIEICEFWLPGDTLAIPCEFEDRTLFDHLVRDVAEHVASSKALRVTISSLLLHDDDSQISLREWRDIKTKCMNGEMEMETLDWRCDEAGVPIIDVWSEPITLM